MSEPLTVGEFERWADDDAAFKERVMDHITNQAMKNGEFQTDIAFLKSSQSKTAVKTGVISAIVAGVTTGITAAIKG